MTRDQVFAFICQICPLCIVMRKYPKSRLGKLVTREKHHCPFCKAYDKVKGLKG